MELAYLIFQLFVQIETQIHLSHLENHKYIH